MSETVWVRKFIAIVINMNDNLVPKNVLFAIFVSLSKKEFLLGKIQKYGK